MKKSLKQDTVQSLDQDHLNYPYYFNGERHTDTSTQYLTSLGFNEDEIKSLQASAKWNQEHKVMMSE
ncbi:TPA: hypothetical protein ACX6QL_002006 [Photobacterium damselae]